MSVQSGRRGSASARGALAALASIVAITTAWWALALWPAGPAAPDWLLRTRQVCFGVQPDGLPDAGGWVLLIGQPAGMLVVLAAVWGRELRAGLALLISRTAGQIAAGIVAALIVAGISGVVVRVRTAGLEPFATGPADLASQLTRIDDAPPAFALIDQHGREITLEAFSGRPVIVAFVYAHCETVCPAIVADVLGARRLARGTRPAVLFVTLDPWRDTPARLPAIARAWGLGDDALVLSGEPETVERILNAWRVPRARNMRTGDISHPALVYLITPAGRIAYVVGGNTSAIGAALEAL